MRNDSGVQAAYLGEEHA
ncbi:MAG: hypothetical protein ACT6UH_26205 [Hydrogenophaga sp.]